MHLPAAAAQWVLRLQVASLELRRSRAHEPCQGAKAEHFRASSSSSARDLASFSRCSRRQMKRNLGVRTVEASRSQGAQETGRWQYPVCHLGRGTMPQPLRGLCKLEHMATYSQMHLFSKDR